MGDHPLSTDGAAAGTKGGGVVCQKLCRGLHNEGVIEDGACKKDTVSYSYLLFNRSDCKLWGGWKRLLLQHSDWETLSSFRYSTYDIRISGFI